MGEGRLIVSLDFELFWGMLDVTTLDAYREHVLGGREAIPKMLALFQEYGIHATWATVGFLFGENPEDLREYLPERGPSYDDGSLDGYTWLRDGKAQDRDCFFTGFTGFSCFCICFLSVGFCSTFFGVSAFAGLI